MLHFVAFRRISYKCIMLHSRAQTHSDAFRCIHHMMHSGPDAFMCIPHDSACRARAPLGSGSIQVHSCAFVCIHIHSYALHHLPHSYSHECNRMYAKYTKMYLNAFELDQLVSSEVVQIVIVAAVHVLRVPWDVIPVLVVLHCIVTGLDVGATYCVSWAVRGARHSAHLLH